MSNAKKLIKLIEGGMGRLSGDATDVLHAMVNKHSDESPDEIMKLVKKDPYIRNQLRGATDDEILRYIEDVLAFSGTVR